MNIVAVEMAKEARERVAEGWVQGQLETADGRCCAWGALECAYDDALEPGIIDFVTLEEAYNKCLRTLKNRVIDGVQIPVWNDAPERTQAEVVAAFDKMIEILESETH